MFPDILLNRELFIQIHFGRYCLLPIQPFLPPFFFTGQILFSLKQGGRYNTHLATSDNHMAQFLTNDMQRVLRETSRKSILSKNYQVHLA